MDRLIIEGPSKMSGEVAVSSAKNAYLPILAATLVTSKPVHLKNLPDLKDIKTMIKLLTHLGVVVETKGDVTSFDSSKILSNEATYDLVKTMRASILVLGPILGRFLESKISLPGGCAIGARPIDLHLKNLKKMNANITIESGYVYAKTNGLKSADITLNFPSVGATENLMMAALFADGETVIENAAMEPEVEDLANFLIAMGAKIQGSGTSRLSIKGNMKADDFKEVTYEAIGDRIEAGTLIMAALITNSKIKVKNINPRHLSVVLHVLEEMGAAFEIGKNFITVKPSKLKWSKIHTAPYPGFPTDLQAQIMTLATKAEGASIIREEIFENRFMHVPELVRLGAEIELIGNAAIIQGNTKLTGCPVMCTDLRASAALVLAAMSAEGVTDVQRVYHLDRGYERLEEKLKMLGVKIERSNPGEYL
ncbi:MAG: UDP-N-acetylglucosamine 1-carboxyvinyltransferase [Bdellovibrionales bacterium RIFOXYA1_FULL_36_14]|nr:MAG: UDP-N-acetylglucosamine 1-carboxyvinyltransferase [Bdellovibrionales bacterium RIFOXYA1_FULL_36_14]